MDSYFKPHYMRWFYSPKTFWRNVTQTFRWLGWSWQRAFKGYADYDVWETFSYLTIVASGLIRTLRDDYSSHPESLTEEEWKAILTSILEGFQASDRMSEWPYEGTSEEQKVLYEEDKVTFETGMGLLTKWWLNLWD
jgi:hypothetical protein